MGKEIKIKINELCIQKLIEIQNCPFCNEKPNIFRVLDKRYFENAKNWVVECKSLGCIFTRCIPRRSLNELLNEWNIRNN